MPPRLNEVGELERPDHYYLPGDARCFFWGEYTPYEHTKGLKWNFSPTNQLISNFKKKMDRRGQADWRYKGEAIEQVAAYFSQAWNWNQLHNEHRVVLVPVPPSKARTDPMFDARMNTMLESLARRVQLPLDIRDCLCFSGAFSASHESDERPTPADLYQELSVDSVVGNLNAQPGLIFLFDDMLTTGAHYVATTQRLGEVFPGVQVVGNFVARRQIPDPFQL